MCLIALAWRAHPTYPLVVAANRDEWRERPTQAAHWWPEHPQLLAGRDLQAGGTWMGYTRTGRFAAITNFRDPADRRSTALSRGTLVTEFLLGTDSPEAFAGHLASRAGHYNGFNLIVGDGASLFYFGSRQAEVLAIAPGIHGLSNHRLDEPWPKVRHARDAMREALAEDNPVNRLFAMLGETKAAPDAELPDTGVGLDWERRLAPSLITGADYGTRASTVLTVTPGGAARFEERTRDASGIATGTAAFEVRPG
ncbi:NRDE family protein [Usitatibacter palustris]|uniref:NRDE family protein n=1 Tax=Usitatibacter palustris TaxID=2732487 RepID=A0A6M4H671_9PROT|nr:NRDE family protein [Usitatibacter palustris]QJR13397.1 hypothetical protein DSM104440_00180 [Usitatibacter palustris]